MNSRTYSPECYFRHFGIKPLRQFLPDDKIREIARGVTSVRDRKFSIVSYFWFLVMAQCDNTIASLKDLLTLRWLTVRKELGLAGKPTPVTKQALSKRNVTTPVTIFENIFKHVVRVADRTLPKSLYKRAYRRTILDASTVDLVGRLIAQFPGGTNTSRTILKAQARLHLNFNGSTGIPEVVVITDGRANEKKVMNDLLQAPSTPTIVIVDLGYWSYDLFNTLHRQRNYFVTRLKANCRPKKIKKLGAHDWLVRVPRTAYRPETNTYRMVSVARADGTRWTYLTNLVDSTRFSPDDIAALYKSRWQIEIFFRDLKHVLALTHFISYSANGVTIQLYVALITYVLIKLMIHKAARHYGLDARQFSFQRAVKVLCSWLHRNIVSLYTERSITRHYDDLLLLLCEFAYNNTPQKKEPCHAVA